MGSKNNSDASGAKTVGCIVSNREEKTTTKLDECRIRNYRPEFIAKQDARAQSSHQPKKRSALKGVCSKRLIPEVIGSLKEDSTLCHES